MVLHIAVWLLGWSGWLFNVKRTEVFGPLYFPPEGKIRGKASMTSKIKIKQVVDYWPIEPILLFYFIFPPEEK